MERLKEEYLNSIVPTMMEKFGYKNRMQVPKLEKIVINVGLGAMAHQKELIEPVRDEIAAISGQKPLLTKAKKSISNFKIRDGAPVGYKVTLRRSRMYEFLDRLVNFVIPRIRDFRGVSVSAFDQHGNYTLGVKDQSIFPELNLDKIPMAHGLDICFVTTAGNKQEAKALLESFGMPFAKK
ncbi:MAG: 50S ribosomal protein L5 [Candidatus Omnitrophica bacterium]|nr:50S ribosomal protein L5 [Candidatus Omnitrophota bacterium]